MQSQFKFKKRVYENHSVGHVYLAISRDSSLCVILIEILFVFLVSQISTYCSFCANPRDWHGHESNIFKNQNMDEQTSQSGSKKSQHAILYCRLHLKCCLSKRK